MQPQVVARLLLQLRVLAGLDRHAGSSVGEVAAVAGEPTTTPSSVVQSGQTLGGSRAGRRRRRCTRLAARTPTRRRDSKMAAPDTARPASAASIIAERQRWVA